MSLLVACLNAALACAADATATPAAAPASAGTPAFTSQKDRISYAVGVSTGRALRTADGAEVNLDSLVRGLRDALEGRKLQIPDRQLSELMGEFQQTLRQKMAASRGHAIIENRAAAEAFLAQNKVKEGVVTLESGVQYRILATGQGPMPQESDEVLAKYHGALLNGQEFDATEEGHPARMRVSQLIPGWRDALKHMPVGSHWQIFVPPQLAYGERGVGAEIGPNELLVFDVELLSAKPAALD
ncbi:MAG: FKBP-type peptidyl-prolyl cis-trans isomerase [Pseudomonadota bacterium]|nr:FKBP-type peptidyl-prolyl cis-trans isomerase [Pseudomonadota bacterium]